MFRLFFSAIYFFALVVCSGSAFAKSECDSGKFGERQVNARKGEYRFEDGKARIAIPKGAIFLDANDARYVAQYSFGWKECSIKNLVGFIAPEKDWQKVGSRGFEHIWMISVFYEPGLVEIEDAISADYGTMINQVRESHVESNRLRVADSLEPINVVGWAVPPGIHGDNLVSWGLNVVEGNLPEFQTVDVKAAKLGLKGHFSFHMTAPITRLTEFHQHLLAVGNAVNFDKGLDLDSRKFGADEKPVMTIGDFIAEDLGATRATPLTWANYLQATLFEAFRHFAFYLVEILAFLTIGGLVLGYRWYQNRHQDGASDAHDNDEDWDEDEVVERDRITAPSTFGKRYNQTVAQQPTQYSPAPAKPAVVMLNGVPMPLQQR
jgi:Protein of unknown function (DUF2167)